MTPYMPHPNHHEAIRHHLHFTTTASSTRELPWQAQYQSSCVGMHIKIRTTIVKSSVKQPCRRGTVDGQLTRSVSGTVYGTPIRISRESEGDSAVLLLRKGSRSEPRRACSLDELHHACPHLDAHASTDMRLLSQRLKREGCTSHQATHPDTNAPRPRHTSDSQSVPSTQLVPAWQSTRRPSPDN